MTRIENIYKKRGNYLFTTYAATKYHVG